MLTLARPPPHFATELGSTAASSITRNLEKNEGQRRQKLPRTSFSQALAKCLDIPRSLHGVSVGNTIIHSGHPQQKVSIVWDISLLTGVWFITRFILFRVGLNSDPLLVVIPLTSLNKKDLGLPCKGRALRTSEVRGELTDGDSLSITAVDDALVSMGEDAADEAVPGSVVHALVGFENVTDFLSRRVSERHDLKMKLTKGLMQSIWKEKRDNSYYTTVSLKWQSRARENIDQIKNLNRN